MVTISPDESRNVSLKGSPIVVKLFGVIFIIHPIPNLSLCSISFRGRLRICFGVPARCGATITHPVCPVQFSMSKPASFSAKNGSPPLPKILSTKSRFATHPPGAKNRTSIDFSRIYPSTAGHTTGLKRRDTQHFAGSSSLDEKGKTISLGRRIEGQTK